MKTCPRCKTELDNQAVVCSSCQTLLPMRTSKKPFGFKTFLRLMSSVCLAIAIFSFFVPFARFQAPIIGSQSLSAFGVVSEIVNQPNRGASQTIPATSNQNGEAHGTNEKVNLQTIQGMAKGKEGRDITKERPTYQFIPIGIILGVVAYALLLVLAGAMLLRKPLLSLLSAAGTCISAIGFFVSLLLLNDALHYSMKSSMEELKDNPFAGLAEVFSQGSKIEPAIAIYLLIAATFFVFIFCWIEQHYELEG